MKKNREEIFSNKLVPENCFSTHNKRANEEEKKGKKKRRILSLLIYDWDSIAGG